MLLKKSVIEDIKKQLLAAGGGADQYFAAGAAIDVYVSLSGIYQLEDVFIIMLLKNRVFEDKRSSC